MTESKVAIVTGAGSGIGRAVSLALMANGYRVALLGRTETSLRETLETCADGRDRGALFVTDVRSASQVEHSITAVREKWRRVDLLFNNAGTFGPAKAFEDLSSDEIQDVVATNLVGSIVTAQAVFRVMKEQDPRGGRIINNGSISAQVPRYGSAAYTMSKHAVTGLTRSLSLDGRGFDIACGQIDIGNAMTDMAEKMTRGVPQADGQLRIEPVMPAAEVARAVWHMATLPAGTNVQFMTVMATAMPYIGRG